MTALRIYILIDTLSYTQHTLSCTRVHVTIHFHTLAIHSPYTYDTFGYALRYTSISSTYTLRYTQHTLAIHFHTRYCALSHTFIHFHTHSRGVLLLWEEYLASTHLFWAWHFFLVDSFEKKI